MDAQANKGKQTRNGCMMLVIAVVIIVGVVIAIGSASNTPAAKPNAAVPSPALVEGKAHSALRAVSLDNGVTMDSLVDVIRVSTDDGVAVTVTLNQTSDALAGSSGSNGLAKIAAAYEKVVMDSIPEVTGVAIADADNNVIGADTRP
jgi:hypothetical protein